MLVVLTYYENEDEPKYSGFRNSKDLALSVSLAISKARENIKNATIKLVCNSFARQILVDHHQVQFDQVDCSLDNYKKQCNLSWSFAKIVAYSLQVQPFIHIDNDFYILKPIKDSLFDNDFIFQNKECMSEHKGYDTVVNKMLLSNGDIPRIFKIRDVRYAYNCGFVFCRNREAATSLFAICNQYLLNEKNFKFIKDNAGYINHVLEQLGIAKICFLKKLRVEFLLRDFKYNECAQYDNVVHLWGNAKRKDEYIEKIKQLLGEKLNTINQEPLPEVVSKKINGGILQNGDKQCVNAVVISMKRNHGGRLRIFNSKFKFPMNLSVIEGIDGLQQSIPKWCDLLPGTYGCLLSHIEAIKFAKENKLKNILILEDDVRFVQNFYENLNAAMSELPDNWDMLWLGGADQEPAPAYSDRLNKLISSWGGYGYILRDTTYDFWLDVMSQRRYACDDYYRRYHRYFNSFRTKRPHVLHNHAVSVRISADKGVAV